MARASSFQSRKTPVVIVLVGSIIAFGPQWRNGISSHINPLVKRLGEENYPRPPVRVEFVMYAEISPALFDPVYSVVGHDEEGNTVMDDDRMILRVSREIAAFEAYMSVIKIIDNLKKRHPNEELSFYVWHIAAGQHGPWDPKWEIIQNELKKRDVNPSMILVDDCPKFTRLFSAISPAHIPPWFTTYPGHTYLLSGFMPSGELGGAVTSVVSPTHPASSVSVPSTLGVTAQDSSSEWPAHGTRYLYDQWSEPPVPQHAGPDVYAQDPAMVPFVDPYEGQQASSSTAGQSQLHFNLNNMSVPDAQGPGPMHWHVPPHGSRVDQQQPIPHNYAEKVCTGDDFANAGSQPTSSGASDKMSDIEWTGLLIMKGACVPVRALAASAIGDPKLSAFPRELKAEPVAGPRISTLSIQIWMREKKAPMVRLSYMDGMDDDFKQLVDTIRAHGYAIVTWGNRERLLLAPLGKDLICAAFPEVGIPNRPTQQMPRKVRTAQRKGNSQKDEKSRRKPRPYPKTKPKSSDAPCDGQYLETSQNTMTPQQPQPEQPPMPCYPQVAMGSTQGELYPPSHWVQTDGSTQHQTISPSQLQVDQHAYLQAPQGEMGVDTAGWVADSSNLISEATDDFDMSEYINFDGNGV